MSNQFFFGDNVANGTVYQDTKITSFKELITSFDLPVILGVTRKEYEALDKSGKDGIKRVRYITPGVFVNSPCERRDNQVRYISIIALDLDNPKHAKTLVDNPGILYTKLEGFNYIAYTTISSTPEAPRLRVLVEASNLSPGLYQNAALFIAGKLGLPTRFNVGDEKDFITRESGIPSQPMFLPCLFRGESSLLYHPVISSNSSGMPVQDDHVKGILVPEPTKTISSRKVDENGLSFLRPMAGVSPVAVESALKHLSPDMGYIPWFEIACGIKHEFQNNDVVGFELFNNWSSTGKKYGGLEATRAQWNSINANPTDRRPITIRTVILRATEAGWDDSSVSQDTFESLKTWILDPVRTTKELSEVAPQKIAVSITSVIHRDTLTSELKRALVAKGMTGVTLKSLNTLVTNYEKADKKPVISTGNVATSEIPDWARGWIYVQTKDVFYHPIRSLTTDGALSIDAFNRAFEKFLIPPGEKKPTMKPSQYCLNVLKCPQVHDYVYEPRSKEIIVNYLGQKHVNTYRADYVDADPDPEKCNEFGDIWEEFLDQLLGNHHIHKKIFTSFMAYQVQKPGHLINFALVMQSAEGAGKSTVREIMSIAIGDSNVGSTNGDIVVNDKWTPWAIGKQLQFIEEIRVNGANRFAVMDRIKNFIATPTETVSIRGFGEASKMYLARTNYVFFTNHHDALAITEGARRYYIMCLELQSRSDVERARATGIYDRIHEQLKSNKRGIRAFFENYRIDPEFEPKRSAIVTEELEQMAELSRSDLERAVSDLIDLGSNPLIQKDFILISELKRQVELKGITVFSENAVGTILRVAGYKAYPKRITVEYNRYRVWVPIKADPQEGDLRDRVKAAFKSGLVMPETNFKVLPVNVNEPTRRR